MPHSKPELTFFGTDAFAVPILERLHADGYRLRVVTKADTLSGRGRTPVGSPVKLTAERLGVAVTTPARGELASEVPRGLIGIVVAYGYILPEPLIARFKHGVINVHASLLPSYRGPSPIEAAIINGDSRTGVTIMQIDAGMDTGPIYTQHERVLGGAETRPQLYTELAALGAETLSKALPQVLAGDLTPQPQDESAASIVGLITKQDGIINWSKPATRLEREIRGYLGWPGSRSELFDRAVTITAARVVPGTGQPGTVMRSNDPNQPLFVYCGEDALVIDRLIPAGKREMSASDFLRGIK